MIYTPRSCIRCRYRSFGVPLMIEEHILQDMFEHLEKKIREAQCILDQVAISMEWREFFAKPVENDILFVSEVLNENNK